MRESERRYREVQMALAHASRVMTMGQLLASISHEIKQPIAASTTNAQAGLRWLHAQPPNLEEVGRAFELIDRDMRRAGDVMNRIRGLVKKAPPTVEPLLINEAIGEVITLMASEFVKSGVCVRTQLAHDLPAVKGDRVALQQVMLNLIINAIEAMGSADNGARELIISTGMQGVDAVLVSVRDSGPGVAAEVIERLFEPFYTSKDSGMGMGLSICHSIVEAHGGQLWANPNLPRGAEFQFTLPVCARDG